MSNTASLPSSNFRLAAMAALAAITVGVTVVDFEVINDDTATALSTAPDTASVAGPAATTPPVGQVGQVGQLGQVAGSTGEATFVPNTAATAETTATTTTVPAEQATTTVAAADEAPPAAAITDDFETASTNWSPMSGSWAIADGRYVQSDATGFDLIAQFSELPPTEFSISVEMTPIDSDLGGGVLIGQTVLGSRRGATLIDFTNAGMFLRWGIYNPDNGQHEYQGGLAMPDEFDPSATHELTVESRASRTMVIIDGAPIADFPAVAPGHVGLATSVSAIAFDNLVIKAL